MSWQLLATLSLVALASAGGSTTVEEIAVHRTEDHGVQTQGYVDHQKDTTREELAYETLSPTIEDLGTVTNDRMHDITTEEIEMHQTEDQGGQDQGYSESYQQKVTARDDIVFTSVSPTTDELGQVINDGMQNITTEEITVLQTEEGIQDQRLPNQQKVKTREDLAYTTFSANIEKVGMLNITFIDEHNTNIDEMRSINNVSLHSNGSVDLDNNDDLKYIPFSEANNLSISNVHHISSGDANNMTSDKINQITNRKKIRRNQDDVQIKSADEMEHKINHDQSTKDDDNGTTIGPIGPPDDNHQTSTAFIQHLVDALTQTTSNYPRDSAHVLAALTTLSASIQRLDVDTDAACIVDAAFTLGVCPSSGRGVYMGTRWRQWVAVPTVGHIGVHQQLEEVATLDQVVGVVVRANTVFGRVALVASPWTSTKVSGVLNVTHHHEHSRSVDAFLYEPEDADERDVVVEAFWEPYSATWTVARCMVWIPGTSAWDGSLCEAAVTRVESLVGCRCRGAIFVEGDVCRARFLVVEESEKMDKLADVVNFKRVSVTLQNDIQTEEQNDLRAVSKVVNKLLNLKPDLFSDAKTETSAVLLDVGVFVHNVNLPLKHSAVLETGERATLVVAEGDNDGALVGLSMSKRWPSDNPDDAKHVVVALHPGGDLQLAASDSEVFVVRLAEDPTPPRRLSLILTAWDMHVLNRYFFKVVFFTRRVADLVFSKEGEDTWVNGVDVVFEPASRDWTKVSCIVWNFNRGSWSDDSCSWHVVSSRLHSCRCRKAVFTIGNVRRSRILIKEDCVNRQKFASWDEFNRTSHHLASLSATAQPADRLPDIAASLDEHVLGNVRANEYVLPTRVLDHLGALLLRLAFDPGHVTAFTRHVSARSTAAIFVCQDSPDASLPTIAITTKHGALLNAASDMSESVVAVSFRPPHVGVGRVAIVYVTTTSDIVVEDRVIHRDKRMVDVSWHHVTSSPSATQDVDVRLEPFVATERPVTVRAKTCRYWDFGRRVWAEGCMIQLVDGKDRCRCTIPMTNDNVTGRARLQIASDWSEQTVIHTSVPFFLLLTSELSFQMVIFHTGCALSLFGLVTVFVTALAFKSWRGRLSNKILMHICSALMLQILSVLFYFVVYHPLLFKFFDFLPHHRRWSYLCLAMGVIWSYSYLARWFWMLVMSLLQLMRICTVMGARNVPYLVLKVSIFAWGGPFLVLGFFLSDPWAYFDEFNPRFYFLTYLLPLSVVLVANLAVFAAILARAFACCGWGKMADLERHGANSWTSIWKRLRTVIVLFFTLEMTWLFELFIYFGYYNSFLHVMSFVVTSYHGFGTFVVFVAFDADAQAGWRAALRSPRKMALLYCAVLAGIGLALALVVALAVLLVCLHTLF